MTGLSTVPGWRLDENNPPTRCWQQTKSTVTWSLLTFDGHNMSTIVHAIITDRVYDEGGIASRELQRRLVKRVHGDLGEICWNNFVECRWESAVSKTKPLRSDCDTNDADFGEATQV